MYVKPEEVRAPVGRWKLKEVLEDRGPDRGSYALGAWDGDPVIAFRWNGSDEYPTGSPQSRGVPTWMILEDVLFPAILKRLPKEQRVAARKFLQLGLRFDGVTLKGDDKHILLFDLSQKPPVVAQIACDDMQRTFGLTTSEPETCRLLADCNRDLLTEAAEELFFEQDRSEMSENGKVRVIRIAADDLAPAREWFSTRVLEIMPNWGFGGPPPKVTRRA